MRVHWRLLADHVQETNRRHAYLRRLNRMPHPVTEHSRTAAAHRGPSTFQREREAFEFLAPRVACCGGAPGHPFRARLRRRRHGTLQPSRAARRGRRGAARRAPPSRYLPRGFARGSGSSARRLTCPRTLAALRMRISGLDTVVFGDLFRRAGKTASSTPFVYSGPGLRQPVCHQRGAVVVRDGRFVYCDLVETASR